MNKACPHCNHVNALDSQVCHMCGRPLAVGSPPPASPDAAPQATLLWTGGPLRVKSEPRRSTSLDQLFAAKSIIRIGRAPECELLLPHPMVSRHHAELQRLPD